MLIAGSLGIAAVSTTTELEAQSTFSACRVPDVGAIYMIGVSGAPSACLDASHVEFSWTEGGALADGSVTAAKLAADAVTSGAVLDGAIGTADIADAAITSAKLDPAITVGVGPGDIGTTELADGAVTQVKLDPAITLGVGPGDIGTVELAGNAVTTAKILDGTILEADIAIDAVTGAGIAPNAVGTTELLDGSIEAVDIQADAVTTVAILNDAVTAAKLAAGSVGTSEVADNSLTADDLGVGSVSTSEVADNSLTAADLAPSSVGTSEIIDGTIVGADIANGTITNVELSGGGAPAAGWETLETTYSAGNGFVHFANTPTCPVGKVATAGGMRPNSADALTGADGIGPLDPGGFGSWVVITNGNRTFQNWFSNFSDKTVVVRTWVVCVQGSTTTSSGDGPIEERSPEPIG